MSISDDVEAALRELGSEIELAYHSNAGTHTHLSLWGREKDRDFHVAPTTLDDGRIAVVLRSLSEGGGDEAVARGVLANPAALAEVLTAWVDAEDDAKAVAAQHGLDVFEADGPPHPDSAIEQRWRTLENQCFGAVGFAHDPDWQFRRRALLSHAKQHPDWRGYFPFSPGGMLRFSLDALHSRFWPISLYILAPGDKTLGAYVVCTPTPAGFDKRAFEDLEPALAWYAKGLVQTPPSDPPA